VAIIGLVLVLTAGAILIRRDLVLRLASAAIRGVDRLTTRRHGPPDADRTTIADRIERTLTRMREIPLSPRSTVAVVVMATTVWGWDSLCLVCSFRAVHAPVPWYAVLLAYGVAVVVGSLPLVPGGFGIVEGSLAVVLVAYGVGQVSAVSAALAFRLVSYWLAIAVGWLSAGVIAYRFRRELASHTRAVPEGGLQAVEAPASE